MLEKKSSAMWLKEQKSNGAERLIVSRSNKKLVPNAETAFIIWNLPAKRTCPGSTAMCRKFCYAVKAETAYPDCLPSRVRNWDLSKQADFVDRMTFTILDIRNGCRAKNLIVRIHESGDFYSLEYANAWLEIARRCAGEKIKFIAYTKSFAFFDGVSLPKQFHLRASIWSDTPLSDLETIKRNAWPIYTAVEKFQKGDKFSRCRCEDCATCGHCWSVRKDIRCEIH